MAFTVLRAPVFAGGTVWCALCWTDGRSQALRLASAQNLRLRSKESEGEEAHFELRNREDLVWRNGRSFNPKKRKSEKELKQRVRMAQTGGRC